MTRQLELLSPEAHGGLCLRAAPGGRPHFVQVVIGEFASAAASCPILLTKNGETGQFYAGAMFGFRPGEVLMPELAGDADAFQPLDLERQGFFIAGENIAIDPAHPRFSESEGEPLFGIDGAPGERLRHIQQVLGQLKAGVEATDAFIQALLAHRLVEPIDISLRFDDGETVNLQGLYTVSLDALGDLDDAAALALFGAGHLQAAYCMHASLRQIPLMARRRNQRLAEPV